MRYLLIALPAAIVTAIDQYTKYMTIMAIKLTDSIAITSFFNIVHVRNKGAAFGFLNNPDTHWQLWFFLGITLVALGAIFFMAKNASPKDHVFFFSLGLISGGAIGNGIDRVLRGSVVDFFDFHAAGWHWPAFNVADIAICLGALLLFTIYSKQGSIQGKKRNLL